MKKIQMAVVASVVLATSSLPVMAQAQVKHRHLKAAAVGVAAYEVAKHSHNRFLHKHRLAAGVAAAWAANHQMKKHHPHH
jgi:hypothetical protein